jgi:hypothetical protein
MKEIVKSKFMMGFVVFIIGISYVNSMQMKDMETIQPEEVVMNETK